MTYRRTKITKVQRNGSGGDPSSSETHRKSKAFVEQHPVYKKVLGSRRYLAHVFYALSIRYERHAAQACLR